MSFYIELKRFALLAGFWSKRTDIYRDLSRSLTKLETPKDFIEGELLISTSVKTANKNRASGLLYMRKCYGDGEPNLHDILVATMPSSDSLALGVLRDSRNLPKSLSELAQVVDQQIELTKMVRSALTTPTILLPAGFGFSYLLSTTTIPEFVKAAPPEVWTTSTLLVKNSAEVVATYGPYAALIFAIVFIWTFVWALPNLTSPLRYAMENSRGRDRFFWILIFPLQPLFSIYRELQGTRMLGNLATLLQANMLLADALLALAEGAQPWMRRHLLMISSHLQDAPGDYVDAFSHGILSASLLGRMHSLVRLDRGSKFDSVLIELGSIGQVESREAVRKSAVRANFSLLIIVMSVILFFHVGQQVIVQSIQDANSPTAVMRRAAQKQTAVRPSPSVPVR